MSENESSANDDRVTVHYTGAAWAVLYEPPRSRKVHEIRTFDDATSAHWFRLGFVAGLDAR